MGAVGYQSVIDQLGLRVLPLARPAAVRAVTRLEDMRVELAVPARMAPDRDDVLKHLLFALKHEGVNLQVLAAVCDHLEPAGLLDELRRTPTGVYIRQLCMVWENVTGRSLEDLPADLGGVIRPLFDPNKFVTTAKPTYNRRWRLQFNGLGDWRFCPWIRRSSELDTVLAEDPLGQVKAFLKEVPAEMIERILAWAYLDETRSTYEIEGERPASNRTEAFAALLKQATTRRDLDETYLVELQNAAVTNPLKREPCLRGYQNYLQSGAPGSRGVTYLPPPPEMLPSLLQGMSRIANQEVASDTHPLITAALVSFGFVFAHPFGDGNGRLSRYLAHYTLCQAGGLADGSILPLSTAMKRNESAYLAALRTYSAPVRNLWDVRWIDGPTFEFSFKGHPSVYRYWDATACTTFFCTMALEAVRRDLRAEVEFLTCHDEVARRVNDRFDVVGSDLSQLIIMAHQNNGVLSNHRRKQFADKVQPEALDYIESCVRTLMQRIRSA